MTQNCQGLAINEFLEKYLQHSTDNKFWVKFHKLLVEFLEQFDRKIFLIQKLIIRQNIPKINNNEGFPLIIVVENDNLVKPYLEEFRAKGPLKFGTDITILIRKYYKISLINITLIVRSNVLMKLILNYLLSQIALYVNNILK